MSLFGLHRGLLGADGLLGDEGLDFAFDELGDTGGQLNLGEIDLIGSDGGLRGGLDGGATVGATGITLGQTALDRGDDGVDDDTNGLHGVVVTGDRMRDGRGIGIGVDEANARDTSAGGLCSAAMASWLTSMN